MAERFEIDQTVQILKNDTELTTALLDIGFTLINGNYPLGDTEYINTASLLLDNKAYISNKTAKVLVEENFIKSNLETSMGFGELGRPASLDAATHQQIFYTFKYAAVKIFFRTNYKMFLPEYDAYNLELKEKSELFVEAFMREFDKFSLIIDNLYNIVDIDKIPEEYLNYLGQLIGYEREDYVLLTEASFRELLKNIIEIYRIKGTNYSMELFFNFLGFDIELQEFWFDKRYGDDGININAYTGETDKNKASFYLTPLKPTANILSGMRQSYLVSDNDIIPTMNLNQFDKWTSMYDNDPATGYYYKMLIGDTAGYTGDSYTFFKTNILQYALTSLGTGVEPELTDDDLRVIDYYIKFLTPLFIQKSVIVALKPYKEYGYGLFPKLDWDRTNPQGDTDGYVWTKYSGFTIDTITPGRWASSGDSRQNGSIIVNDVGQVLYNYLSLNHNGYIYLHTGDTNEGSYRVEYTTGDGDTVFNNVSYEVNKTTINLDMPMPGDTTVDSGDSVSIGYPQSMFHLYQGNYPSNYYFQDGDMSYGDTIPGSKLKYGGHWISGFHTDTYNRMYDSGDSTSVYSVVKAANPTYTHDAILQAISDLLDSGDSGLWDYSMYGVRKRDLIAPMRAILNFGDTIRYDSDFSLGKSISFGSGWSFNSGDTFRLSESISYSDTSQRVKILSIDVDAGTGDTAYITVDDPHRQYRELVDGDSIEVFYLGDSTYGDTNNGIYTVRSAASGGDSGDSGDTTTIIIDGILPGADRTSAGGFVILYANDWSFGNNRFPFYFDRILNIDFTYDYSKKIILSGKAATEYTI